MYSPHSNHIATDPVSDPGQDADGDAIAIDTNPGNGAETDDVMQCGELEYIEVTDGGDGYGAGGPCASAFVLVSLGMIIAAYAMQWQ